MFEPLLQHWFLLSLVLITLIFLWIAAVLSKYVRLMLNILRDNPPPLLIGPIGYERIEGRHVTFRAFDGTTLNGMFISPDCLPPEQRPAPYRAGNVKRHEDDIFPTSPAPRGIIIFCHEYGADMYSCARYCLPLLEAGFDIFTFDFRSHGRSSDLPGYQPRLWCTDKEIADCLGALSYVKAELDSQKLQTRIGLFGISRGGAAALICACQAQPAIPVHAVIADSAFSNDTILEWSMKKWVHIFAKVRFVYENHHPAFWPFLRWLLLKFAYFRFHCRFPSVRKTVPRMKNIPVFFIHGGKDSHIRPQQAQILYDLAGGDSYLWIVPQAKHNQSAVIDAERYATRTVAFLEKYLIPPGPPGQKPAIKEQLTDTVFFAGGQNIDSITEEIIHAKSKVVKAGGSDGGISRRAKRQPTTEEI